MCELSFYTRSQESRITITISDQAILIVGMYSRPMHAIADVVYEHKNSLPAIVIDTIKTVFRNFTSVDPL